MSGTNLSQSIQEKQALARGTFFDKGFFINLTIFLLVVGLYGGARWYLGNLNDALLALQEEAATKTAGLESEAADRATDLSVRLKAIAINLEAEIEPEDAFQELERFTITNVRLTGYAYAVSEGTLSMKGVTANLKYLAQQMLSYRKMTGVASVHVKDIKYTDAGQVEFALELPLSVPVTTPSTP